MNSALVSVIVPIYKVERFLRKCVESVLAQTYQDFELLLVDDGSPDHCGEICDEYAKKNSRVKAFHKGNGGLSSARNYGLDRASGKWIIFLDSDDVWGDRDGLRKLVEYAEEYNLDILRFEYQAIDKYDKKIYPRPFVDKDLPQGAISNYQMVDKAIAGEWFAWLYIIRKDVIGTFRFDEACPFQEDIDFYCKFFAAKEMRCGYIPEKIYHYRKREASITTSANINNLKGSFNLCDVFAQQSELIADPQLKNLYRYNAVMMYYWTLGTLSEAPYYSTRKDIIAQLNLYKLHTKTYKRMKCTNIPFKSKFFIIPGPSSGATLLRIKNMLGRSFYKFLRKN